MRVFFLIIFLAIADFSYGQLSPAPVVRMSSSAVAFGVNVPKGAIILDISNHKLYQTLKPVGAEKKLSDLELGTDYREFISNEPYDESLWDNNTDAATKDAIRDQLELKEKVANKSTDGTLATNSDILFPTQKAVKTYVDAHVASAPVWSLAGNSGNTAANFLGTTDDQPLFFRIDNVLAARIAKDNLSFGYNSGVSMSGNNNLIFGTGNNVPTQSGNILIGNGLSSTANNQINIGNVLLGDLTTGHFGLGSTDIYSNKAKLFVKKEENSMDKQSVAILAEMDLSNNDDSPQQNKSAVQAKSRFYGAGKSHILTGITSSVVNMEDGILDNAYGNWSFVDNNGSGNMDRAAAGYFIVNNSGTGNIQHGYGIDIGTVEGQKSWGIHNTGGQWNYFSGNLGIGGLAVEEPTQALDVDGQIRIRGGNPGPGKVLTSDADGIASWESTVVSGGAWLLNGNSGTNASTDFIGTTDAVNLNFKANNLPAGLIDISNGNSSFGYNAMAGNSGMYNTSFGSQALAQSTSGNGNVAVGFNSLNLNETGSHNTAVGRDVLVNNTTGELNTGLGYLALFNNEDGVGNIGIGFQSMLNTSSGSNNTAIGNNALYSNTTGNNNTSLGVGAGFSNQTGENNVFIGKDAGRSETGSDKLFIDNQDRGSEDDGRNKSLIYGTFNSDPASQTLTVNGQLIVNNGDASANSGYVLPINRGNTGQVLMTQGDGTTEWGDGAASGTGDMTKAVYDPDNINEQLVGLTATQTLTNKTLTSPEISSPTGLVKSDVGLANVDNTSDLDKPISTLTQEALDLKENLANKSTDGTLATNSDILYPTEQAVKTYVDAQVGSVSGWSLSGNSGTTPGTNFIGTTDDKSLIFKVNNTISGKIENGVSGSYTTSFGYQAGANLQPGGSLNTFFGFQSGSATSSGDFNTGVGALSLVANSTGGFNTAIGSSALWGNTTGESNTAIGYNVLAINSTGTGNVGVGSGVMTDATSNYNTSVGAGSLEYLTTGANNVALGYSAGLNNSIGSGNIFIGSEAGYSETGSNRLYIENSRSTSPLVYGEFDNDLVRINGKAEITGTIKIAGGTPGLNKVLTSDANGLASWQTASASGWSLSGNSGTTAANFIGTIDNQPLVFKTNNFVSGKIETGGNSNTTFGYKSASALTSGTNNAYFGFQSGSASIGSDNNVGVGYNALAVNVNGDDNTAVGSESLSKLTGGALNTAIGVSALKNAVTAFFNTAVGSNALLATTSGGNNVAIGSESLKANTTGNRNVAIGWESLLTSTTVSDNTAIGTRALRSNTSGDYNTAIGSGALYQVTSGYRNTGVGSSSLGQLIDGNFNTGMGAFALGFSTSGSNNTAFGYMARGSGSLGSDNAALGSNALSSNAGNNNVGIGSSAGSNNNTGSGNIFIGYQAGAVEMGSNKLYIENSFSSSPLIYGEFDNDLVRINGKAEITGTIKIAGGTPGLGKVLTSDATGLASWQTSLGSGDMTKAVYDAANINQQLVGLTATQTLTNKTLTSPVISSPTGLVKSDVGLANVDNTSDLDKPISTLTQEALDLKENHANKSTDGTLATNSDILFPTEKAVKTYVDAHVGPTSGWSLSGNSGTTAGTNFIGTTDAQDLTFKVNNQKSGLINSAEYNTAFGYQALNANLGGGSNTAIGASSQKLKNGQSGNTSVGAESLYSSGGSFNTAVGFQSLYNNTAFENVAFGYQALYTNNFGQNNTGIGFKALYSNTFGTGNTALGNSALLSNTQGFGSVAIGNFALYTNSTGSNNNAIGSYAMQYNTTGTGNSALGNNALNKNTTGSYNSSFGERSLMNNIDGSNNIGFGNNALSNNTSGGSNVAVGTISLGMNTVGTLNTAVGTNSLLGNTVGNNNTALGASALRNGTGDNNVAIGYYAGNYTTGSNKLFIDNQDRADEATEEASALIVGQFDAIPANQYVKINGNLTATGDVKATRYLTTSNNITAAATTTLDLSLGNVIILDLDASVTLDITNANGPQTFIIKIAYSSDNTFTIDWPSSFKWSGGTAPTLTCTTGMVDIVSVISDGTNYYCSYSLNF